MKAWLLALGLTHFCIVCAVTEWSKFTPYTYTIQAKLKALAVGTIVPAVLQQGQKLSVLPCTVRQYGSDMIIVEVDTPTPNGCVKKAKIFRPGNDGNYYCITPGSESTDSLLLQNGILALLVQTLKQNGEPPETLLTIYGQNKVLTPTLKQEIINYAKGIGFMENEIIFEPKEGTCQ